MPCDIHEMHWKHIYYVGDPSVQGMKPLMEAGWPGMAADSGGLGSHDFTCEVSSTYRLWIDSDLQSLGKRS